MPSYSSITLATFHAQLSTRLRNTYFWTEAELTRHINEALRTWQSASFATREHVHFTTTTDQAFYILSDEISELSRNLTDRSILLDLQDSIMEPNLITGNGVQFSPAYILAVLQKVYDEFLQETQPSLSYTEITSLPSTPIQDIPLPANTLSVVRAAWRTPEGVITPLSRTDEFAQTHLRPSWRTSASSTPKTYSILGRAPLMLRLFPVVSDGGALLLITQPKGATLDPTANTNVGTPLAISPDHGWILKYGVLRSILTADIIRPDQLRGDYSEARWEEGVRLAKMHAPIIDLDINGVAIPISTLASLDGLKPSWANQTHGTPTRVAVAGQDLIALSPIPSATPVSVDMDVVRNAILPTTDSDNINLDPARYDAIMEYARHLALFKCGGMEFQSTLAGYKRLIEEATEYNATLRAQAKSFTLLNRVTQQEIESGEEAA